MRFWNLNHASAVDAHNECWNVGQTGEDHMTADVGVLPMHHNIVQRFDAQFACTWAVS